MPEQYVARAHAKINLGLRVGRLRSDGFHEIETVFQSISLFDTLRIVHSDRLSLRCDQSDVPVDSRNLVWRAAEIMMNELGAPPVAIELQKKIPIGGGLGGGSSDAAATLLLLARLSNAPVSTADLAGVALRLGSDVPFFLMGGTAYATGRGEMLTALPQPAPIPLLLVFPDHSILTSAAFRKLDETRSRVHAGEGRFLGLESCRNLIGKGLSRESPLLQNDFESVLLEDEPLLRNARNLLLESGAIWALMSGSGSTFVGAFDSTAARDAAESLLSGTIRTRAAEMIAAPAITISTEKGIAFA